MHIVAFKFFGMKRGYVHVWGRVKMCGFYGYAFWNLKVYKRKKGKKMYRIASM